MGLGAKGQNPATYEPLEQRRLMSVNVITYHYNNAETGANTNETALTLANVNTSSFGKIASFPVDGEIYGQPLIVTGVAMSNTSEGTHDIVLVTTENDSVYAFDAYGNNPASGYLWKTSLLQTGETAVPVADYGTNDITPVLGITGTPVINPATNILYVVGLFKESNATYQQRLYALNISSGANAIAPVTIAASVSGSTFTNTSTGYNNPGGVVTFSAFRENQRPALTLANGEVYIGWSSHGDENPWHGWVMAYNAATLHQDFVYCNTVDGEQGGIWMSGGGLAVDANGNLYFTSGNGTFDANTNTGVDGDYSMALEELSPSLTEEQYFTPYNQASLSNADLDYGCANVILLTGQGGADPNEVLSAGKWGTIYLNNMASLGGYNSNGKGPNNDLGQANLSGANLSTSNVHNTMVYWNGSVYLGGDALTLQAFSVANSTLGTTPSSQTSHVFGSASVEDGQGAGLTVSSNGASNGIVWALDNSGFLTSPAVLYAYNASNLAQTPLWTSSSAANGRDTAGIGIKFQDPVVANGHVYVAGDGSLTVYGLFTSSVAPTLTSAAAVSPTPVTGTTATLTALATDPSGNLPPLYTWTATSIPSGATTPTFSVNGTATANVSTATFYKAGAYTFSVSIENPNSGLFTTSTVNVTVNQTLTTLTLSPSSASLGHGATQQFTVTDSDQFGNAFSTQPGLTWSVVPGGVGGTINSSGLYTAPATGTGPDTVMVTSSPASGSLTASAAVTVSLAQTTTQLSLSSLFNAVGIVVDGSTFGSGIDNDGSALSGTLLGTSATWNGSSFTIAANTSGNTTNNVLQTDGQTIVVAPGKDSTLKLLAAPANGPFTLSFVANYADGSTQTITQGFSDWYSGAYTAYPNQGQAISMAYRDLNNGTLDRATFYVYGYNLALNPTKVLTSITLPTDPSLNILSMDTIGLPLPTINAVAVSPSPATGTTITLAASATDTSGDAAPTFTWAVTNMPSGATTPTISPNGTGSNISTATLYQAGSYTFTLTVQDPTNLQSTTSSLTVNVVQTLTSISILPSGSISLTNGQTQQFSAVALDQFGNAMSTQPSIGWAIKSGPGSVNSAGLYQAPASGSGTAVVQASAGTVSATVSVQDILPVWLGSGSAAIWNSSTHTLTVTGATSIVGDPGVDQPIITANGSAAVVTFNPVSALQIHLGGLSLYNGASGVVTSLGAARTAANHRVLVLGVAGATTAPVFMIDANSQLNLTDNDLVDHDGSFSSVNDSISTGFRAGPSPWTGPGIITSIATGQLYTLGDGQALAAGTFDSETVAAGDVEVRYTYFGDATLDGKIDGSDYSKIDYAFTHGLTGWTNGDFNYDGVVDGSDYTLIDNAFNTQAAALDALIAKPATMIAKVAATQATPSAENASTTSAETVGSHPSATALAISVVAPQTSAGSAPLLDQKLRLSVLPKPFARPTSKPSKTLSQASFSNVEIVVTP
jgi:hypothetical protein